MYVRQTKKNRTSLRSLIFLYLLSLLLLPGMAVAMIFFISKENQERDLFAQYGVNITAPITDRWEQKGTKGNTASYHILYTFTLPDQTGPKLYSQNREVTKEEYARLASQSQVTVRYLSYQPEFSRLVDGEVDYVIQTEVALAVIGLIEIICIGKIVLWYIRHSQEKYRLATWGYR
jgi:hypothetical protein